MSNNELTWKDIQQIDYCIRKADSELSGVYSDKKLYELALKKFKEYKSK